MTKKEVQKRVLQNGEPLDMDLFEWDEKTNTFSSEEDNLVMDFRVIDDLVINCGDSATIDCGHSATIDCGDSATIDCGHSATIDCGHSATINCGHYATINCGYSATINPQGEKCVVVRRDVYEAIELKKGQKIKLNDYGVKGYTELDNSEKKQEMLDKAQELIEKAEELKQKAEEL